MGRWTGCSDFTGWGVAQDGTILEDEAIFKEWGDCTGWDAAQDAVILQDGTIVQDCAIAQDGALRRMR